TSRRSLALREALSGPWQAKQFSARMGRTSRLYSILSGPAARADKVNRTTATAAAAQGRMVVGRMVLLLVTLSRGHRVGHGPAPVLAAGINVPAHGPGGRLAVAGQQALDDGQVLVGLLGQAVEVVAGLVLLPGDVAERPEQDLQPAQLLRQEGV